jgi:predicted acyltransferase
VARDLGHRNIALDALRGLMIIGMILVNHPPPDVPVLPPLAHAEWHGWTFADTIFPGFLVAVGMAARLSLCDERGVTRRVGLATHAKLVRRFVILFLLNYLLINFPYYFHAVPDFTGTLAQIGWCSLTVAVLVLYTGWKAQLVTVVLLLAAQWTAYALLPVPGFGAGSLTPEGNAARYVESLLPVFGAAREVPNTALFGLPTMGAVSTTLIGALVAPLLLRHRWAAVGACCRPRPRPRRRRSRLGRVAADQQAAVDRLLRDGHGRHRRIAARGAASRRRSRAGEPLARPVAGGRCQRVVRLRVRTKPAAPSRLRACPRVRWVVGASALLHPRPLRLAVASRRLGGALAYTLLFLAICYLAAWILYRRRIFLKL